MASSDPGRTALAALDHALAERPHKDGHQFAEAAMCLAEFRDRIVARQRAGADERTTLLALNGVISAVLGGHFPLGSIPWPEIEAARRELAKLVDRA